jgi:hypothetical protein
MRIPVLLILSAFVLYFSFSGCRKDPLDTDPDAQLLISTDTIFFDTVFTTIGSATRQFKVFNTSSKSVNISSIKIAGGSASNFHMNVDGVPTSQTGDILLRGGDSMYVFVDVTVDPNNLTSPLMVQDSILFETNGNQQKVILNAVGRDAYLHYREVSSCGEVWPVDKPHLVYDYVVVPSSCILTIPAGADVYVHKNGIIAADSAGTLIIQGTQASPVKFQGDRLEPDYADEPGQWNFIWLSSLSKDNIIDWAIIKNGNVGVLCDTMGGSLNPTLRISNTKIMNMALAGIFGRGTWMEGDNLEITNCAQYCTALAYGGKYQFRHCTFGNYWNIDSRTEPALLVNNWFEVDDVPYRRDLVQADFYNCIVYGDLENEVGLDSNVVSGIQFNYFFSHCLLKTNVNTSAAQHFQFISFSDPQFVNIEERDFRLSPTSPGIDVGDATPQHTLPNDLDNYPRPYNSVPDLGAYEWHP